MQFDSFSSFVSMGGYAFYVWLSFGVTFGAMLLLVVESFSQHKRLLKVVLKEQQRQLRIKEARQKSQTSSSR